MSIKISRPWRDSAIWRKYISGRLHFKGVCYPFLYLSLSLILSSNKIEAFFCCTVLSHIRSALTQNKRQWSQVAVNLKSKAKLTSASLWWTWCQGPTVVSSQKMPTHSQQYNRCYNLPFLSSPVRGNISRTCHMADVIFL